ncbi:MAG: ribonuclease P protein component [Pseudomonadota bacterium]
MNVDTFTAFSFTDMNSMTVAFPKSVRLLHAAEYKRVFDEPGARSVDPNFTVLARRNGLTQARLGMAITRKNIKTAVARNRIKRIVRESFRQHQQILAGLDIVVLSRGGAGERENPALFASLEHHWSRVISRCNRS